MPMNSVSFKNFVTMAMLVLLSFLILGVSVVLLGRNFLLQSQQQELIACAQETSRSVRALGSEEYSSWNLQLSLSGLANVSGARILLANSEGYVAICSDSDLICEHLGRQISAKTLTELEADGTQLHPTTLDGLFDTPHYVALQTIADDSGNTLAYVLAAGDTRDAFSLYTPFITMMLVVAVGVLLFAICMSFYTSRRRAIPLRAMADAAQRFAHGDFSVRVDVDTETGDEMAALTQSFNDMADAIEQNETTRSNFISNVSHELKTPMTTIAGFADGILDGTIPAEQQSRYLQVISAETKRLNRLVRQMLDMSQLQRKDPEQLLSKSFDLSETLVSTLLNFEKKITDKDLDMDLQLPESAMWVLGDKDSITQVIYNLVDNAVKFSPPGAVLQLRLWKENGKAYVAVRNQGDTIPPEDLPLIFDRFHKTDRSRSKDKDGVGLGLYIVKTILDNHRQDITVTSENGCTEFTFTMLLRPAKAEKQEHEKQAKATQKSKPEKKPKQPKAPKPPKQSKPEKAQKPPKQAKKPRNGKEKPESETAESQDKS